MDGVITFCLIAVGFILLASLTAWLLLRGGSTRIPTQIVIGSVVVFLIVREVVEHFTRLGIVLIAIFCVVLAYQAGKRARIH